MLTDNDLIALRSVVETSRHRGRLLANLLAGMASEARVFGEENRPIRLSPETADSLAEAILSNCATNRLLLERAESAVARKRELEACAVTGMVLVTQLKRMKLRQVISWWLQFRERPVRA